MINKLFYGNIPVLIRNDDWKCFYHKCLSILIIWMSPSIKNRSNQRIITMSELI